MSVAQIQAYENKFRNASAYEKQVQKPFLSYPFACGVVSIDKGKRSQVVGLQMW